MTEHQRRAVPTRGRPVGHSGPGAGVEESLAWVWRAGLAIAVRPALWGAALRMLRRTARRGWWRHWPPIPVPSSAYLGFRVQTHTGVAGAPSTDDVLTFVKWSGSFEGVAR